MSGGARHTSAKGGGGSHPAGLSIGRSDGEFKRHEKFEAGDSPRTVAIGDFDRDAQLDLAVGNRQAQRLSILIGKGDGTFKDQDRSSVGGPLLGRGDGTFDGPVDYPLHPGSGGGVSIATHAIQISVGVAVKDLDSDGKLDLAATNAVDDDLSILRGTGDGTLHSRATLPSASGRGGSWPGTSTTTATPTSPCRTSSRIG